MSEEAEEGLLTTAQAAARLGIGPNAISSAVTSGRLKPEIASKQGGRGHRFTVAELDRYDEYRKDAPLNALLRATAARVEKCGSAAVVGGGDLERAVRDGQKDFEERGAFEVFQRTENGVERFVARPCGSSVPGFHRILRVVKNRATWGWTEQRILGAGAKP